MNTGTAIFISRNNKTILQSNDEFVKLTGRKEKAEVEDHKWPEFFHPDDIKQMCEYHTLRRTNVSTAPRNYETRLQRLPGDHICVEVDVPCVFTDENDGEGEELGEDIDLIALAQTGTGKTAFSNLASP